ncbi:MAG TPA: beta-galactosidase [Bacilli bacterium]
MNKRYAPISPKVPRFLHGADYNPDQWLHDPAILDEDIRLMKLAKCNVMSVGIFAWSRLEPEEGVFDFAWLDQVLDRLAENGIYVWLATPSGARPAWMSAAYPEVLRVGPDRVRIRHGGRHNHCYTSPVYREKVACINRKLAERYAAHPAVIGWHISNEYGGECHCELCQAAFRQWLKARYGTLEALNHAWWTAFWSHTFTSWEQIESPAPHGEMMLHGLNLDWKRFVTDQTVDFCRHEIAPLKAIRADLPVTANMMEAYEGLNYWKFAKVLDVVSWDAYPAWHDEPRQTDIAAWAALNHDMFRSLNGGKPFVLMESTPSLTNWQPVSKLKRPGMHLLSSLQAVAHGADSVQYFQWRKSRGASEKFHGAVIDHCGHEHTRVFRDVAEVGAVLEKLDSVRGTAVHAEAAVIFDWENRWAVKDAQGPRNIGLHYEETVLSYYKALWELGIAVDVVDMEADFSKYKLVVAPMLYMVRPGVGAAIERFVEQGGIFVATYWSGIVDQHDLCFLGGFPGPLRRVLGVWAEEAEGLYDHDRNSLRFQPDNKLGLSGSYEIHEFCELIHAETAEIVAVYEDDFYAGRPVVTENAYGLGKAYYVGARTKEPFCADFLQAIARAAKVQRALNTTLPPGVTAQVREDDAYEYVFVMNFSGQEQQVALDERDYVDLLTAERLPSGSVLRLAVHGMRLLRRNIFRLRIG